MIHLVVIYFGIDSLKQVNPLNHWWIIVNWTIGNRIQWNLIQDSYIFIQENVLIKEDVLSPLKFQISLKRCEKQLVTFGFTARQELRIAKLFLCKGIRNMQTIYLHGWQTRWQIAFLLGNYPSYSEQ